ncbi:hypothetical protein, partial [Rhodoblastus acidophilus]|uniref:hypothetical protein n=2 Tax=Rhodoblastus acidophilus TaxID=1074 RepID=UPI001AED38AE
RPNPLKDQMKTRQRPPPVTGSDAVDGWLIRPSNLNRQPENDKKMEKVGFRRKVRRLHATSAAKAPASHLSHVLPMYMAAPSRGTGDRGVF